ncbi:MAG: RNA-binding protein [Arachidicoccus sp.]|nr:RNA-binding protein [Arachidicoccus sp.]
MNIFVSNLSFDILDEDLRGFFEEFGTVDSSKIVFDRETRRSRGFGFVEMPNEDEARKAIKALDGGSVEGRPLKVNEAKPREERPRSSSYGSYAGKSRY